MFTSNTLAIGRAYAINMYTNHRVVHPNSDDSDIHEALALIPEGIHAMLNDADNDEAVISTVEQFDDMTDNIVTDWVAALTDVINVLSSTVAPVYADYLASVKDGIAEIEIPSSASSAKIKVMEVPEWYLDSPEWNINQTRGTTPVFDALPNFSLEPFEDEAVMAAVRATILRYDTKFWAQKVSMMQRTALTVAFNGGSSAAINAAFLTMDTFTQLNNAVMMVVLSHVLTSGTHVPTIQVNQGDYLMRLRDLRLLAQTVITRVTPVIKMNLKTETLIVSVGEDMNSITVLGPVYYDVYLKQGGTPDALLGRMISRATYRGAGQILERVATYTNLWISYVTSNTVAADRMQVIAVKRIMKRLVDQAKPTPFEIEHFNLSSDAELPSTVKERMFAFIDTLTKSDIGVLPMFVAEVIGKGRFGSIGGYEMISNILVATQTYPGRSTGSAVYAAILDHVASFIASKVELLKV